MAAVDERGKARLQIGGYILKVRSIRVSIFGPARHDALTQPESELSHGPFVTR
jgi:hypothetical protein